MTFYFHFQRCGRAGQVVDLKTCTGERASWLEKQADSIVHFVDVKSKDRIEKKLLRDRRMDPEAMAWGRRNRMERILRLPFAKPILAHPHMHGQQRFFAGILFFLNCTKHGERWSADVISGKQSTFVR